MSDELTGRQDVPMESDIFDLGAERGTLRIRLSELHLEQSIGRDEIPRQSESLVIQKCVN